MENASKALIIAGAILLSILLISLGIMIFTQAQDVVSGSGMTEAQISTFNTKFSKYIGQSIPGTQIRALVQDVLATNADSGNQAMGVTVSLKTPEMTAASNKASDIKSDLIVNNKRYKVTSTNGDDGRINVITVEE